MQEKQAQDFSGEKMFKALPDEMRSPTGRNIDKPFDHHYPAKQPKGKFDREISYAKVEERLSDHIAMSVNKDWQERIEREAKSHNKNTATRRKKTTQKNRARSKMHKTR